MGRKKSYEGPGVTVYFEASLCIHAAECVHRLPEVFDPNRRPWIEPTAAGPDAVARVVERCPTGALTYALADGESAEPIDTEVTLHLKTDGPLYLRGKITLTNPEGVDDVSSRLALCRCGHSKNKPFCDNSHVDSDFRG